MKRRGFIASFVAAIVAAAISLGFWRARRTKPPEPEEEDVVSEEPARQTITGEEDAAWPHFADYSRVRPTKLDLRPPINEAQWRDLIAQYGPVENQLPYNQDGDPWEKNYEQDFQI